jgi:hypothetical protein
MLRRDATYEARRLLASGYRATSNKYRMISRIDREDWEEYMASLYCKGWPDQEKGMQAGREWVKALGPSAGDHYRRCMSTDVVSDVDSEIFWRVRKGSSFSERQLCEYLPMQPVAPRNIRLD